MLMRRKTLFRLYGFDVKADMSWAFISILTVWMIAVHFFPRVMPGHDPFLYYMMSVAVFAGLVVSILAHEVGHAVIAEHYDMQVTSITFFIVGGVAEIRGAPSHPKGEFLMTLAGPAMSLILALFFSNAARYVAMMSPADLTAGRACYEILKTLGFLNYFFVIFNMIPAFPLDGGRALRAALWHYKKNFVQATRIASELGEYFGYTIIAYGCFKIIGQNDLINGIWIGFLGYFTLSANQFSVRQAEARSLLSVETTSRFLNPYTATVSPDLSLHDFVQTYVYQHYQRFFPVVMNGKLAGLISLQTVLKTPRNKWQWLHIASVMEPVTAENTIMPDTNAADALNHMEDTNREMLMIARDGKLSGVVTYADLLAYLRVTLSVDPNKPVEYSHLPTADSGK